MSREGDEWRKLKDFSTKKNPSHNKISSNHSGFINLYIVLPAVPFTSETVYF